MAVILTGNDMPRNCWECEIEGCVSSCPCMEGYAESSDYKNRRHDSCPLKSVDGLIEKIEGKREPSVGGFNYMSGQYNVGLRDAIDAIKEYCEEG